VAGGEGLCEGGDGELADLSGAGRGVGNWRVPAN
jgi:hypothetical protein